MVRIAHTSALYALFDGDDKHHDHARGQLADPEPVEVPSEIVVETVNLLEYRFGWDSAKSALRALVGKPHVSIADQVPTAGVVRLFERAEGTLSLAGAVVVQTAQALGAEAWTYDGEILAALV